MKLLVVSVFDVKVGLYGAPIVAVTPGHATRIFEDLVNDERSSFFKHPADFRLFQLGTFDDSTGELVNIPPLVLGEGVDSCATRLEGVPRG